MNSATTSLRQLARLIGVSERAIRKAVKAGVFQGSIRRDEGGVPGVVDVTLAVQEWERSGRQLRGSVRAKAEKPEPTAAPEPVQTSAPPVMPVGGELGATTTASPPAAADAASMPPLDGPVQLTLVDAQRLAVLERARKLRLENDEQEGKLVDVTIVAREQFNFARTLREAVLNVPARLSAELAAQSDASQVYRLLDAALRQALEATASALEATA